MTKEEKELLKSTIREEGIHYALTHYSDWSEIEDDEFHLLLTKYQIALEDIEYYIENVNV